MPFLHVLPFLRFLMPPLASFGLATSALNHVQQPRVPVPEGDAACQVRIEPRAYRPGDVLIALVHCEKPPTNFRARFAGVDVAFFPVAEPHADEVAGPHADEMAEPHAAEVAGPHADEVAGCHADEVTEPHAEGGEEPDDARPRTFGALLGIDLAASPGTLELVWEARFPWGDVSGSGLVSVERREFPSQRIQVPKRLAQPDSAAQERIRLEAARLAAILSTRTPQRLWRGAFDSPLPRARGGGFGARRVVNGVPSDPHAGLDIAAPTGEPVHASNEGRVALVDSLFYAGKTVVLDHGLGLFTIYSHLSQASVIPGDLVQDGHLLGRVGATGRVTGPHLHWAVRMSRARVDPIALMSATAGSDLEAPELHRANHGRESARSK